MSRVSRKAYNSDFALICVHVFLNNLKGKCFVFNRRFIWEDNLAIINKHNEEAAKGHHSYWMGINQFADMVSYNS